MRFRTIGFLAVVAIVVLAIVAPAARPVLGIALVAVLGLVLVLVVAALGTLALLYRRAVKEVRADPHLVRPPGRTGATVFRTVGPPAPVRDGQDDPVRALHDLSEQLQLAHRTPHLDEASRRNDDLSTAGHVVHSWVRGPDHAVVDAVHDGLTDVAERMITSPRCSPARAERLRRISTRAYTPTGRDWRDRARDMELPPAVLAITRLLLANRRWRSTAAAYHRSVVLWTEIGRGDAGL